MKRKTKIRCLLKIIYREEWRTIKRWYPEYACLHAKCQWDAVKQLARDKKEIEVAIKNSYLFKTIFVDTLDNQLVVNHLHRLTNFQNPLVCKVAEKLGVEPF